MQNDFRFLERSDLLCVPGPPVQYVQLLSREQAVAHGAVLLCLKWCQCVLLVSGTVHFCSELHCYT